MKVIMVSTDYLPNIGGLSIHIYNLSKFIKKIGIDVEIVNPKYGNEENRVSQEMGNLVVHRIFIKKNKLPYYRNYEFNMNTYNYIKNLVLNLDHNNEVIIHQHDYLASSIACNLLKKKKNLSYIWTNHTSTFIRHSKMTLNKITSKFFYKHVDGIVSPSKELYKLSKAFWHKKKNIYIPNGVDINLYVPISKAEGIKLRKTLILPKNKIIIFCPRRWDPKNGIIYLVNAIKILSNDRNLIKNLLFIFAGNYGVHKEYEKKIYKIIQNNNLDRYIKLLGKVSIKKMVLYNQVSDIVIIPSLIEAVSLSALEAMACEKVVIASNVGGLPEIIRDGETGFLVIPKNEKEISKTIFNIVNDLNRDHIYQVKKRARKLVENKYSWEKIAKKTLSFYKEVLEK